MAVVVVVQCGVTFCEVSPVIGGVARTTQAVHGCVRAADARRGVVRGHNVCDAVSTEYKNIAFDTCHLLCIIKYT